MLAQKANQTDPQIFQAASKPHNPYLCWDLEYEWAGWLYRNHVVRPDHGWPAV